MEKRRYYRVERNGIECKHFVTKESKDRQVAKWKSKGYEVKVNIIYM